QAQGLLQRDLVEGVGGQLHAVGDHAGAVRPDLDADVGVHHALVGDQDLHRWGLPSRKAAASSGWTANSSESRGWPAWPWAILPASGTRPRGLDAPPRHPQRWQRFAVVAAVAPLPAQAVPGADG